MSDWLIAGIALLALFVYALIERRAVDLRGRNAWDRVTRQGRAENVAPLDSVERIKTRTDEEREAARAKSA